MPKKKDEKIETKEKDERKEGREILDGNTPQTERTQKEILLELYQTLKDLGINSIGDLEVKISRL